MKHRVGSGSGIPPGPEDLLHRRFGCGPAASGLQPPSPGQNERCSCVWGGEARGVAVHGGHARWRRHTFPSNAGQPLLCATNHSSSTGMGTAGFTFDQGLCAQAEADRLSQGPASKGVSVVRFLWPQAQSCQAWVALALCEGVGIGDRAHPAAPQRITTVGIPPAVGLRLVLMPVSLKCCSTANFFGPCPPASLFCCRLLGFTAVVSVSAARPQVVSLCRSNAALGVRPRRGLLQASGLVCSQSAERAPYERPLLL